MSVHPDHAALIAEARSDIDYMRQCWRGATIEPEYSWLANYIAVVDALASAPSPRTPLPLEVVAQIEALPVIEVKAVGTVIPWGKDDGVGIPLKLICREQVLDALAAAPKVEQRTPTREAVAALRTRRTGSTYNIAIDHVLALFTSPEAPEPEAR